MKGANDEDEEEAEEAADSGGIPLPEGIASGPPVEPISELDEPMDEGVNRPPQSIPPLQFPLSLLPLTWRPNAWPKDACCALLLTLLPRLCVRLRPMPMPILISVPLPLLLPLVSLAAVCPYACVFSPEAGAGAAWSGAGVNVGTGTGRTTGTGSAASAVPIGTLELASGAGTAPLASTMPPLALPPVLARPLALAVLGGRGTGDVRALSVPFAAASAICASFASIIATTGERMPVPVPVAVGVCWEFRPGAEAVGRGGVAGADALPARLPVCACAGLQPEVLLLSSLPVDGKP